MKNKLLVVFAMLSVSTSAFAYRIGVEGSYQHADTEIVVSDDKSSATLKVDSLGINAELQCKEYADIWLTRKCAHNGRACVFACMSPEGTPVEESHLVTFYLVLPRWSISVKVGGQDYVLFSSSAVVD